MENKPNIYKSAMNYGAIVGFALVIYSVLMYMLDLSTNRTMGNLSFIILLAGIIFGIKNYRDKVNDGIIAYTKSLGLGILITVFAGIISTFYSYIQMTIIDPELPAKIMEIAEEAMLDRGMTEEQVEMQMQMTAKMMKPLSLSIIGILSFAFYGTILSLIVSIFMKKEGDPFVQDTNE
ncbi:DUF4199 domain-containing protein [Bacteroidota bacterium]